MEENINGTQSNNTNDFNSTVKREAKEAKGFLSRFFKNPINALKEVAEGEGKKYLKYSLVILLVWLAIALVTGIINLIISLFSRYFIDFPFVLNKIWNIIQGLLAPILSIVLLSTIVYLFKKNKTKTFLSVLNTVTLAKFPLILVSLFNFLTGILLNVKILYTFTSTVSSLCALLSAILVFFAVKHSLNEDESKPFFWKYAMIIGIFYGVKFLLSFILGISIL